MDNEGPTLSKLFKNLYVHHKDMENTCCLNKESGEVFVEYFNSIESNIAFMDKWRGNLLAAQ